MRCGPKPHQLPLGRRNLPVGGIVERDVPEPAYGTRFTPQPAELTQLIGKEELGEWTGQSPGRDQMDLSLQVKNRRVAGACVQRRVHYLPVDETTRIVDVVVLVFETVPVKAFICTMLFSMMRLPLPSLEMLVTNGPAVEHEHPRRATAMMAMRVFMQCVVRRSI